MPIGGTYPNLRNGKHEKWNVQKCVLALRKYGARVTLLIKYSVTAIMTTEHFMYREPRGVGKAPEESTPQFS